MRLECQARRVQLELVLERQQRTVERLLAGAAAALPTAKLEHVKAVSSHWYDVRLYVQNTCIINKLEWCIFPLMAFDGNIFSLSLSLSRMVAGTFFILTDAQPSKLH